MNGNDLEGSGYGLNEVFFWHLSGETDEDHEEILARITGVSAKIQTEHLLNMNVEHYCYIIPIDQCYQWAQLRRYHSCEDGIRFSFPNIVLSFRISDDVQS